MTSSLPTCPLCGNAQLPPPRAQFTTHQAAAHFCPPTRNRDRFERFERCIRGLWGGDSAEEYICPTCDFGFAHPFVGGSAEFYEILHEQAGYPQWRWEYDVVAQEVLAPRTSGGRILDIGTGDGSFLRPLGPQWEKCATESTPAAQERLKQLGLEVFPDLPTAVREGAGTFQVVTMFQSLEHIASFKAVLLDCRHLLGSGGTLAVSVPDRAALLAQEKLTRCPDMPPNHVNKWSPNSLARALKEAGFAPRPPRLQPASWAHVPYALQLRLMANASRSRTLAAQVYRIRRKPTRVFLLAVVGGFTGLASLPALPKMRAGFVLLMMADAA